MLSKAIENYWDEEEFDVSVHLTPGRFSPSCWAQIAEREAEQLTDEYLEEVADSEHQAQICNDDSGRWIYAEENKIPTDVFDMVNVCLKEVKKLRTANSIKMVTQLIAFAEYVKLCKKFQYNPKYKWPCLSASLTIVQCMGKGPYFAHQIC